MKSGTYINDHVAACFREFSDMCLLGRKTKLHLEPTVCFLLCHQALVKYFLQGDVCITSLTTQCRIRQRTHGKLIKAMSLHIRVAGGVLGADVVFFAGIAGTGFIDEGCRAQKGL